MSTNDVQAAFATDVIVLGAGPIGLTTACALGHHGVRFRLFEQRTKPSKWSKANNVWARTQELMHSVGVRDALAEKSYRVRRVNTVLNGRPTPPSDVADVDGPFGDVLYSGQGEIEDTLSGLVAERGGAVERGRKVTAFEQDDEGVTVTVVAVDDDGKEHGEPERVRCRYLVAADGSKGFAHHTLGLDYEKEKLPNRMNRSIDARLKWRRSTEPDQLYFFLYRHGFAGVLPVWGGYHRLYFLQDDAGVPDRDPTLAEIQALAREVTGDETLELSDPIWATHSRFQHGVADHYAVGRVFLAGDAGHLTLPIGGQGMNAGFHDAVAIAWRLAMTIAGCAGPAILDSYDVERGGEHIRLDAQQAKGFRQTCYRNWAEDAALNVAASVVPDIGTWLQGTDDLQQMSVAYPKSPLNDEHMGLSQTLRRHVPAAGDRAPDSRVVSAEGETTLFKYLYEPDGRSWGWALLAFDGRERDAAPLLLAAARAVERWEWVRPRLILAANPLAPEVSGASAPMLSDLDGLAHAAYALEGVPALVLVRPDGHIAFRGPAHRPELLEAYCSKVFR